MHYEVTGFISLTLFCVVSKLFLLLTQVLYLILILFYTFQIWCGISTFILPETLFKILCWSHACYVIAFLFILFYCLMGFIVKSFNLLVCFISLNKIQNIVPCL